MKELTDWFQQVLDTTIRLYFKQESEITSLLEVKSPLSPWWEQMTGMSGEQISFEEKVVIMLALMPHLYPQALDIFFVNNKNFDRPYTEFGGWKGLSHGGFLPTGETVAFMLAGENTDMRSSVVSLFEKEHWFYIRNILRLEGGGEGEPFLSGQLRASDELLSKVLHGKEYKPDYSTGFPAKRITTPLNWNDMVLDYQVAEQLEEINTWITGSETIMEEWGLKRILKPGYRTLFYGPPGTGKTLAATLLGKRNGMDVYRVDLSMIVSKYIGETEKNLARIFDMAENRRWILFFDEADALFGKRTSTQTSNDRHANQEVAYLLQRIEDFPGMVVLATNLRSNIDEAFSRRFQSIIYFPMPDEETRYELWEKMLPPNWLVNREECIRRMANYELAGGAMTNVIRSCALYLMAAKTNALNESVLVDAIRREQAKEGVRQ
ncbi:ATP-binding protein [Bacteroides sp.]|uniref:ATP-binding protein n=1 Tax=Bacteroides sp. TaxID=29523 RepID=UPI002622DF9E|nr:ATP-binding protein [Bacteroides sp.]